MPYTYCEQIGKEIRDISDEIPFDIPDTWEWIRLGDLCEIINGFTPLRSNEEFWNSNDIPWFTVEDIHLQGREITSTKQFISKSALSNNSNRILPINTILLCCTASVGEYAVAKIPLTTNQQFNGLVIKEWYKKYFYYLYLYHIVSTFKDILIRMAGKTTFNFISVKKVSSILIPFPPISEQHRIVSKIEELLPYIEKYGKAEEQLTALNTTFPEALKKSILQEAVQGKLVPQNPDDEPASVLLERIRAEKQALIKAGKIKKDKHESVIVTRDKIPYEIIDGKERCIADEVPFELPDSWCWCRFTSAIEIASNLVAPNEFSDYLHIAPDNIQKGNGILLSCKTVLQDNVTSPNHLVEAETIIYSKIRPLLRKAVISPFQCLCSADMYPLKTSLINKYVLFVLLSDCFNFQVASTISSRVKMPKINQSELSKILIPVPPLAEQKRIVSKIEEIMPFISTISK